MKTSKLFYDKESSNYDSNRWSTPVGQYINIVQLNILNKFINGITNNYILEIAAGTGRFTQAVLDHGHFVTVLDISESMLAQLQNRLMYHPNYQKLKMLIGDARNIEIESNSMDLILCFNALSHIPEYKRVLEEVYRVLKPNGTFLFNIPNYFSLYLPFGAYVNLRKKSVTRNVYTKWYSLQEIKKDLTEQGFIIQDIIGQLHVPTRTPSFLLPIIKLLDHRLRNGFSNKFAPILFIKAKKID